VPCRNPSKEGKQSSRNSRWPTHRRSRQREPIRTTIANEAALLVVYPAVQVPHLQRSCPTTRRPPAVRRYLSLATFTCDRASGCWWEYPFSPVPRIRREVSGKRFAFALCCETKLGSSGARCPETGCGRLTSDVAHAWNSLRTTEVDESWIRWHIF
jgi:hypothetical protein